METVLLFHTSRRQAWRKEQDGAFRFARTRGWRIQVVEPAHGRPRVRELIDLWKPIGCLVECSGEKSDFFDPADFARVPTVFLGRDPRTLPAWASYVNPSPKGPGARAAMELLKAGLQSFAFIASSGNHFWSRDREAEFRSILHLHGLDCAVFGRKESFRSEKARGKACAAFLKALPKPCGVMAENDYQAVYVLDLARRMRIAVPSQMAVIGVDDDTPLCENAHPALSSVYLDFEQAGYRTCEILSQLVADPSSKPIRETYGALGLMRRGSTPTGSGTPRRGRADSRVAASCGDGLPPRHWQHDQGRDQPRPLRARGAPAPGPLAAPRRDRAPLRLANGKRAPRGLPQALRRLHARLAQRASYSTRSRISSQEPFSRELYSSK